MNKKKREYYRKQIRKWEKDNKEYRAKYKSLERKLRTRLLEYFFTKYTNEYETIKREIINEVIEIE